MHFCISCAVILYVTKFLDDFATQYKVKATGIATLLFSSGNNDKEETMPNLLSGDVILLFSGI